MRTKVKDALAAVEEMRNKEQQQRAEEDVPVLRLWTMVCKVGEVYERQVPIFARKVKFLDLARVKGEGYKEWANIINQQSELAHLEGIKAKDL